MIETQVTIHYERKFSDGNRSAVCHPDKRHVALGLCRACYQARWASLHKESSPRKCLNCGHRFYLSVQRLTAGGTLSFCGRSCANKARATDVAQRIDKKVDRSAGHDGCWPWTGVRDKDGYGLIQFHGNVKRVTRLLLELTGKPLSDDVLACHHCDNPPCCNPAHLFRGTALENSRDMIRKGRQRGGVRA